jgi:hypothetical protein
MKKTIWNEKRGEWYDYWRDWKADHKGVVKDE